LLYLRLRSPILYNEALVEAQSGNVSRAIVLLEQAIDADDTNVVAYTVLGKLYAQQGRFDRAQAAWERALALDPQQEAVAAGRRALASLIEHEGKLPPAVVAPLPNRPALAGWLPFQLAAAFAVGCLAFFILLHVTAQLAAPPTAPVVELTSTAVPANTSPLVLAALSPTPDRPTPTTELAPTPLARATPINSGVVTVSATPTAAAARTPASAASAPSPTLTPVPDLTTPVLQMLSSHPEVHPSILTIQQDGSTVVVHGSVATLAVRYQIETLIRAVPGVHLVDLAGLVLAPTYVVQPGDSLVLIATNLYGTSDRWPAIAAANGLAPPYLLQVGQRLVIPGS
jgi:nucleoid-associated protein YgaU